LSLTVKATEDWALLQRECLLPQPRSLTVAYVECLAQPVPKWPAQIAAASFQSSHLSADDLFWSSPFVAGSGCDSMSLRLVAVARKPERIIQVLRQSDPRLPFHGKWKVGVLSS